MEELFCSDIIYKGFIKYITLINDYLIYCSNNLPINENYYESVYNGLTALRHVFILLIQKTHNSDYTNEIMQKCYIYYIEFITQVNIKDNHLNLTPFDAVIFIYKKSIFNYEANNEDEYKMDVYTNNEIKVLDMLSIFHLNYFNYFVESHNSKKIEVFTKNIYLITENIIYIHKIEAIEVISSFTRTCYIKNINYDRFNDILILFIKLISKITDVDPVNIQHKLEEHKIFNIIQTADTKKITKQLNAVFS